MNERRLHHRSKTHQQQQLTRSSKASTTIINSISTTNDDLDQSGKLKLSHRPEAHPRKTLSNSIKRSLKVLIFLSFLLTIAVYSIAILDRNHHHPSSSQAQDDWWISHNLTQANRFMLVVAHPDDECLFFSPTLLNLPSPHPIPLNSSTSSQNLSQPIEIDLSSDSIVNNLTRSPIPRAHILSLSSGNAHGLGPRRTREMRASCWAFGIPSPHCIVLDHPDLPDSMSVWWPESKIQEFVKVYVDLWKIDVIITFDHHGISGHPNHRAIAAALSRLAHSEAKFPLTFMLRSSSLVAKYSSLLALPYHLYRHHQTLKQELQNATNSSSISLPSNTTRRARSRLTDSRLSTHHSFFLSSPRQYYEGRRAFNQHVSQNVWFRRLWLIFSRYMWYNELIRIVPINDRFEDSDRFGKPTPAEQLIFPPHPKQTPTFLEKKRTSVPSTHPSSSSGNDKSSSNSP